MRELPLLICVLSFPIHPRRKEELKDGVEIVVIILQRYVNDTKLVFLQNGVSVKCAH